MTHLAYELQVLLNLVISQMKQILPYWLLGTLLGSILSVYASKKIVRFAAHMRKRNYSFFQALLTAVLGVISPVCMYGTVPILAVLSKKNVPQYILVTFMISSIMLNPNLFLVSFSLGVSMALLRLFISITAGMLAGILVFVFYKGKDIFNFNSFENITDITTRKKNFLIDILGSMRITAPYMFLGMVLTALFDRYFPPQIMNTLFIQNRGHGVLLMASLGVPVYLCGGGTVPLLGAWLEAGMSPGSAAAFMISGPSTKLTNLSAVKIVLGTRNFALYIAYNLLFAVAAGFLIDFLYYLT